MANLAIISDKLAGAIAGAESILYMAHELYPEAPIYATTIDWRIIPEKYKNADYRTTFLQEFPWHEKLYKAYFPLMPLAHELLNLQEFDVLFSSHYSVAKGIIPRPDAVHICYCHSPARYIWDMFWTYASLNGLSGFQSFAVAAISQYLRIWDNSTAGRVDHFLANSRYTAQRIKRYYNREAEILYPPVYTNKFQHQGSDDYYLMVGRLVAYKGFELALEAFNESGKRLVIIGAGPELEALKAKAKPNVTLLGRVSDEVLIHHMNHCKGFVFGGKEDFGIVMAEAQSAGKPVIALKAGGALDIVKDNETGILFETADMDCLNQAIVLADQTQWNHVEIASHAKQFDSEKFRTRLKDILDHAHDYAL
jgi:glycosyltransferase involved in cell wall biosynthesis